MIAFENMQIESVLMFTPYNIILQGQEWKIYDV